MGDKPVRASQVGQALKKKTDASQRNAAAASRARQAALRRAADRELSEGRERQRQLKSEFMAREALRTRGTAVA